MADILFEPSTQRCQDTNLTAFLAHLNDQGLFDGGHPQELHQWSVEQPEAFWNAVWDFCGIVASERGHRVIEPAEHMRKTRFFPEARLNFAENLLRYDDEQTALLFRGENGDTREFSYQELRAAVAELSGALKARGVGVGDRVAGYLPNMPETIIAMLATTSLGAIWSSGSPDFGVNGIVDRFGQIEPKVLFTVDGYFYNGKVHDRRDNLAEILERIPSIEHAVVIPFTSDTPDIAALPGKVTGYAEFVVGYADHELTFEQLPFDHPVYVLYSSGTTGVPKCIVHGAGNTLIQHLKELVLHADLKRSDRIFYFTTCGWMMWNWLVSSLAVGATTVLFDGSPFYPGGEVLPDLIDEFDISIFGTSAKYIAALDKAGVKPAKSHRFSSLHTILSTGSPLLPEHFDYVYRDVKKDVALCSISGGTDIVSCFVLGNPLLPVRRGEIQCAGLGMDVKVLDENSGQAVIGQQGELACVAPFPSMPVGFWNDPDGERYEKAYFSHVPGIWCHGDHAEQTDSGGFILYGRSDATLNPGGVRIGTAEIYRQVEKLDSVLESIAVGQKWGDDERVILFVRLREGIELNDALIKEIRSVIRANTTPRHVPAKVLAVTDIPRTISGKIVELAVRNIIHGKPVKNQDALANPEALQQFENRAELQAD
jgi:acetoacetyl-CoA synthetase